MKLPKPVLVSVGGVAGALARWTVVEATDSAVWSLAVVNAVGAFLLGAIVHGLLQRGDGARLLFGVGFCGALTTLSMLAVEVAGRLDQDRILDAAGLGVSNVALGLAAALLGASTRQRVNR